MASFAIYDKYIEQIINDPIYDIRPDGTIWTKKPLSGVTSPFKTYPWRRIDRKIKNGYWVISYYQKFIKVSRIVYRKYNGKLDPLLEVNHRDGNKDHNYPSNLNLLTNIQNVRHAVRNGLVPKGTQIACSKLTPSLVKEIRALAIKGWTSYGLWKTKKYGVDRVTIDRVIKWKNWRHIVSPLCEDIQI